ncbi:hypothetical protein AAMO2058_001205800 [Amorphochlora amoebiformis]
MEYVTGLLRGILRMFGFFRREATVVLLGLDNAGKTSLQHKLTTGQSHSFVPTQKPHQQEFTVGNVTLKAWDLGGHKAVRKLWKTYYRTADGIVFVVDAADRKRMGEARKVLRYLLREEALKSTPMAILGNKSDLKDAVGMDELRDGLGLPKLYDVDHKIKMFRTSVLDGYGYPVAFEWIAANLPDS